VSAIADQLWTFAVVWRFTRPFVGQPTGLDHVWKPGRVSVATIYKNSSGHEIANVNFFLFYDDIVHVEASAYAHWTDFLISTIIIYANLHVIIYTRMPVKPSYQSLFCPNNRWIIAQIVLIWSETIKSRFWNRGRPNNCFTTTYRTRRSRSLKVTAFDTINR